MTLEILQNDMIQAMKDKDSLKKEVLSSAIAAIKNAAIAKKCKDNITQELVDEVLLKEKKTLQEQLDTCPLDRPELMLKYDTKFNILNAYCPKLLDNPADIEAKIRLELAKANVQPFKACRGLVMKTIMPIFKGKADMKIVNQIIGEILE